MYYSNAEIKKEIQTLRSEISKIRKEISFLPEGRYRLRTNYRTPRFSVLTGSRAEHTLKEKYIPLSNNVTSVSHVRRYYLSHLMPVLESELDALEFFQSHYSPFEKYKVYDELPEQMRDLILPVFSSFEMRATRWANANYDRNPMEFDESQLYITKAEVRVRSRAEHLLADLLTELGLFYRYEPAYELPDGSIVYPDFTVMHPLTERVHYIEYFGMMSNDEYRKKAFRKIQEYQLCNDAAYFHFFFETSESGFNSEVIRNVLTQVFFSDNV